MRRLLVMAIMATFLVPISTPANATTLSCAEGGVCVVGDTGPGGGKVFFVKSVGSFEESFTVVDEMMMDDPQIFSVNLTSDQQAALSFDYLEVAPTGRSGGTWGSLDGIAFPSLIIGSGKANTDDILLTQTGVAADNAARYAKDYVGNGLTDWFLPSYHELLLIMLRVKLGDFPSSDFPLGLWASSTGGATTSAYYSALNQLQGNINRSDTSPGVRPIRAFSAPNTAPDAPTIGTATALSPTSASISFLAPANNGGATIETYTATSTPGTLTGQLLQAGNGSITVTGLTPSTAYTFKVTASNSVGTSSQSSASVSITMPASDEELAEQAAAAAAQREADTRAAAAAAEQRREFLKKSARESIVKEFKDSGKTTIEQFSDAQIPGITAENIAEVQEEILALSDEMRGDIAQVLKVARKYEVVGIIASDRVSTVYSNSLVEVGLIPQESANTSLLTYLVRKLPESERTNYAQIKAVIDSQMIKMQQRQDRLAAVKARIAAARAA